MHSHCTAISLAMCVMQNRNKFLGSCKIARSSDTHHTHLFLSWEEIGNCVFSHSHFIVCQGGWASLVGECKQLLFLPLMWFFLILCFPGGGFWGPRKSCCVSSCWKVLISMAEGTFGASYSAMVLQSSDRYLFCTLEFKVYLPECNMCDNLCGIFQLCLLRKPRAWRHSRA